MSAPYYHQIPSKRPAAKQIKVERDFFRMVPLGLVA